jgi:hypothetical protein
MVKGEVPFRDFFHHQFPGYITFLSSFLHLLHPGYFTQRLLSFIGGILSFLALSFLFFRLGGWISLPFLFPFLFLSGISRYFFYGLPNSLMVTFTLLSFLSLFLPSRKEIRYFLGGFFYLLSFLIKPHALFNGVFFLFWFFKDRFVAFRFFSYGVLSSLVLAWTFIPGLKEVGLYDLLFLQRGRLERGSGLEIMSYCPFVKEFLPSYFPFTPFFWNLYQHLFLFSGPELFAYLIYFYFLFRGGKGIFSYPYLPFLVTLFSHLLSNFFLWEPVWDHYFLLYLPFLSILSIPGIERELALSSLPSSLLYRIGFLFIFLTGISLFSYISIPSNKIVPEGYYSPRKDLFTLNPTFALKSAYRPVCGGEDPFNTFGDHSLVTYYESPVLRRFQVTFSEVVSCLKKKNAKIYLDPWSTCFFSEKEIEILKNSFPDRVRILSWKEL